MCHGHSAVSILSEKSLDTMQSGSIEKSTCENLPEVCFDISLRFRQIEKYLYVFSLMILASIPDSVTPTLYHMKMQVLLLFMSFSCCD